MGKWRVEWPTLLLLVLCYLAFGLATTALATAALPAAIIVAALSITLHASLTHEVIHGHPSRFSKLNAALVFPALNPLVPFVRFRETHLSHHIDANLTDPYDDPETNYLDPAVWVTLPRWMQLVLRYNNTLFGRILLGPMIGQIAFVMSDARAIWLGDRHVLAAWLLHIPAVACVLVWLIGFSSLPLWAYAIAVYVGAAILRIRTYLEHQAHERASGRTAIVEDRGILALLFLNNNLHVVHHMHPRVAWYDLPDLYRTNRQRYLTRNGGYVYRSYGQVLRRHFWTPKDQVPHPLWTGGAAVAQSTPKPVARPKDAAVPVPVHPVRPLP